MSGARAHIAAGDFDAWAGERIAEMEREMNK
jgi:hypothetical protein